MSAQKMEQLELQLQEVMLNRKTEAYALGM